MGSSAPAVAGLFFHIGGHIRDLILGEGANESGHLIEAVGHLGNDCALVAVVVLGQVGLEIVLLEGVLTVHNIAAAGMAGSAVGREHLGAIRNITSECGERSRDQDDHSCNNRQKGTHWQREASH